MCLTLCDPMDCSLLSSSVHGTLQARILEWIAISQPRDRTQVSCITGRFFTIGGTRELFYNVVLDSAIHQHELAQVYIRPLLTEPPSPPPTPSHSRLSQSTSSDSLPHTADSHWLSILHMVMYIFHYYSLNSSYTLLPPLCPQVSSLCLCLYWCPADRFIRSFF